jgi:hypothetical protein
VPAAVYHLPSAYPVLDRILAARETLMAEALDAFRNATWTVIRDNRVDPDDWAVLPLLPEPEDRPVVPDWEKNRLAAPRTDALLTAEPAVKAYSLMYLRPGGYIRPHKHDNPFVTAIITLQEAPGCYMMAAGERRDFSADQTVVFDYRRVHEARNPSTTCWIALLLLLEPA